MSSKSQVDESRLFSDEDFLQLCTDAGSTDRLTTSGYEHLSKRRQYDPLVITTNQNAGSTNDAINRRMADSQSSQSILTIPDQPTMPAEDVFELVDGVNDNNPANKLYRHDVGSTSNRYDVGLASGRRRADFTACVVNDRESNHSEAFLADSIAGSHSGSKAERPDMMMQQARPDNNQPILTCIDVQTGEFCVQMGGHSYPIEIDEIGDSNPEGSRWMSNPPVYQPSTCNFYDAVINDERETDQLHSNVISDDSPMQLEDPKMLSYDNQRYETSKCRRGVERRASIIDAKRELSVDVQQDCEYNRENKTRKINFPRNDGAQCASMLDNTFEQKWFNNLAQYGDSMTRLGYEQHKTANTFKWEPNCAIETNTSQFFIELPPIAEVLSKSVDHLYDSNNDVLRYYQLGSSDFTTNCSLNEQEHSTPLAATGAYRSHINTMANQLKMCNHDAKNSFGSKDDQSTCITDRRTSKPDSSYSVFRREPLTLEMKRQMKKMKRGCRLWEFIRNLLLDPTTNPSLIRWENREIGTFKLVQSKAIAYKWGMKKGNEGMTYEKLSRAMRYYYKRKVFQPVLGKRLVYSFGPRATGWRDEHHPTPSK